MLVEIAKVRRIQGEARRRWFNDESFDLVVWLDDDDRISGFQLAYGKGKGERAVTWRDKMGFRHDRVDDGETGPFSRKSTPILLPDGVFDRETVTEAFHRAARGIDPQVTAFVLEKLKEYPSA